MSVSNLQVNQGSAIHVDREKVVSGGQPIKIASGNSDRDSGAQPPLDEYFNSLFTRFGPQHWWPAKTPFEVIIGAVLTQNTSWSNVEPAIANLRAAGLLTPEAIHKVGLTRLERLIRPSGYFRQKA